MGRRAKKAPVSIPLACLTESFSVSTPSSNYCSLFSQVQTKKRPTLAKRFKCPFCANEEVVECKMDNKAGIGSLKCRLCGSHYEMPIHHLHEPIDVFSEWLDECEALQNGGRAGGDSGAPADGAAPRYNDEDDEDDDLPQPVDLGGGNKKRPAQDTGARKKQKTGKDESKPYTDLGLDDSDSDSDED